jgi:hypothetical protein
MSYNRRIVQARLSVAEQTLLTRLRRSTGLSDSEIVRQGLLALAASQPGLEARQVVGIGKFDSGQSDLGSNKRHLRGFGSGRR